MRHGQVAQAARLWGDGERAAFYAEGGLMWKQLEAVRRRINTRISGDPAIDWLDHAKATHLAGRLPVDQALSLCCGTGWVERELMARGVCRRCVGYDASPGALAQARAAAAEAGYDELRYVEADVNLAELPAAEFDLIVSHEGLHHIDRLKHVTEQINRALRPDGLFVAVEYVGPNRFEYSPRQLEVCTAALQLLPERFRHSVSWQRIGRVGPGVERSAWDWLRLVWLKLRNGTLLQAIRRRTFHARLRADGQVYVKREVLGVVASEMALYDPTEAVRSAELQASIAGALDVIEYKPFGGSILAPLLDDIAGNFEGDDPAAPELLRLLFTIEDTLMGIGEFGSDFGYFVARKRVAPDNPSAP